ncbi:MAG: hypothetical protein ACE5IR_26640 [bacterium]
MNLVDSSGWLEYFADDDNATLWTQDVDFEEFSEVKFISKK